MHALINLRRWMTLGLASILASACSFALADQPAANVPNTGEPFLKLDSWEPIAFAERQAQATTAAPLEMMPTITEGGLAPVPDSGLMPLSPGGYCDPNGNIAFGLDAGITTDGGRPDDWSWGCGGSPYRNGPGYCDNWKVGCRWETYVDGVVMFREQTDLSALRDATGSLLDPEVYEQFDHAVGGRVSFMGYTPRWANYNVQAAYEGAEAWNASVVFPKQTGIDGSFEQETLFYRTNLHSAELNVVRTCHPVWRPYFGVRYIKLDDEINHSINQEFAPPLPGPMPAPVVETDVANIFDIENDMIGIQIGLRRDLWRIGRMFSLQGYANAGVYHNQIKRSNIMATFTTQMTADDTDTPPTMNLANDETSTTISAFNNNDVSDLTEISYLAEASITGICRLNRCCALRGGYQILWLNNIHLADDEYLMPVGEDITRGLVFQGWHAGFEYRR